MLLFNLVGNIHTTRSDGLQILQQGTKRRCERRVAFSLLHALGVGAEHFCAQLEEFGARELELFAINVDIADEAMIDVSYISMSLSVYLFRSSAAVLEYFMSLCWMALTFSLMSLRCSVMRSRLSTMNIISVVRSACASESFPLAMTADRKSCVRKQSARISEQSSMSLPLISTTVSLEASLFVEHAAHEIGDARRLVGNHFQRGNRAADHLLIEETWFGDGLRSSSALSLTMRQTIFTMR